MASPASRIRNRTRGRSAVNKARDQARLKEAGGLTFYTALPGEDALTIAGWFGVLPSAIELLTRLPQNRPLLVKNGRGELVLRKMVGGERVRIPETWLYPAHPAFPSAANAGYLGGIFDDDEENTDPPENTETPDDGGCPAGSYPQAYPGCADGYSWQKVGGSWGCCVPDEVGNNAQNSANGMPCGNPNGGTVWKDGVCQCDEAAGYVYSSSEDRCVPVGQPCDQTGGIWNTSGECYTAKMVDGQDDAKCCPEGGTGVSGNRMNPDCSLTGPSKTTAAGAPECTKYDACKDDFIPIPGCTKKGNPTGGSPSGSNTSSTKGTPGTKTTKGTKPAAKGGKTDSKSGTATEGKAKGWTSGQKTAAAAVGFTLAAAAAFVTRKKWMPKG